MSLLKAIAAVAAKQNTPEQDAPKREFQQAFDMRFIQENGNYKVPEAGFATATASKNPAINPSGIASCREVFANRFTDSTTSIFFNAVTRPATLNLALFFRVLEDKLGLAQTDRTVFSHQSGKGVVLVGVSKWWSSTVLRRQIFTILLRCGTAFTGDFQAALTSNEYAKATMPAVKRFIAGYTKGAGTAKSITGWMIAFHNKSSKDVESMLVE